MRLYTRDSVGKAEFSRIVTKEAADQLGVARVSAWALSEDHTTIECMDLYLAETDEHQSGLLLQEKDFPQYFNAFLTERVIAANDARTDPRTCDFTEVYLKPNHIFSMLDAQIRSAAGPRGVVCIETVNTSRNWSPDEVAYAASVSELIGFSMDREERATNLSQLKEVNERYDLAMDAAVDGIWDFDLANDHVFFSTQNFTLLGEVHVIVPDKFSWWEDRVHPGDATGVLKAFDDHIKLNSPFDETYRIKHSDGTWRWWRSRGQVLRDANDRTVRVVGTNSDVTDLIKTQTELKQRNQELVLANRNVENNALHDVLTDLPNRRNLERVCKQFRSDQSLDRRFVSILQIDLDNFKDVNDQFGHAIGDATLVHVARQLNALRHPAEFVARIGGDEFVAILDDVPGGARATAFCVELNNLLSKPKTIEGHSIAVSASIGVTVCSRRKIDIWQRLRDADLALYEAKRSGRCTSRKFHPKLREKVEYNRIMKDQLNQALADDGQIVPYFQAQFDAQTLQFVGFEVLARWQHPDRGLLLPADFLGFAEESNCVAELDRQILRGAVNCLRSWRREGFRVPRLSVNISSQRLVDPKMIQCVEALGDDVRYLSFELLETVFLDVINDEVSQALDQLRTLGVEFEIDDFGSGYASILGLVNVRPKRLKIDRSLIRNVSTDDAMVSLVKSIVDIAQALKIEVVAEGVENEEQATALAALGCDILQGFHLAMPISSAGVISQRHTLLSLNRSACGRRK
ncbi:EAL domain-containing protein [Octadecabacter sp. 1_MG-2023]|uniref:putative bifunctional diguanylate cyclase/phosphodiesterase n=1 Tax=unclassified Octadecabacter TaxID=196158 RepID=UPI001C097BDD|nr:MULTISPECIES: EAL domain-containing protein [unclassified Octadecabacter]MDO6734240.1 EAL domain-containing protein [Octadecabacter sp. 1_MG-2023]